MRELTPLWRTTGSKTEHTLTIIKLLLITILNYLSHNKTENRQAILQLFLIMIPNYLPPNKIEHRLTILQLLLITVLNNYSAFFLVIFFDVYILYFKTVKLFSQGIKCEVLDIKNVFYWMESVICTH